MFNVHAQFGGHEVRIKAGLIHNVLQSLFLFFGFMFFFLSLFQLSLKLLFFLLDFSQILFSFSPVNEALSMQFFSTVDVFILILDAFDVSSFDLFHAKVGKFFADGLSL